MAKENIGAIGIDLGTFTSDIAIVERGSSELINLTKFPTLVDEGPESYMKRIVPVVNGMKNAYDGEICALGIGIPSWSGVEEAIMNSPNMKKFNGFKILGAFRLMLPWLEMKVVGDNDANVAGFAEEGYGNHHGAKEGIAGYTLGGGVGFYAFVLDPDTGKLFMLTGRKKRAGEGGHRAVPPPPGAPERKCGCGYQYCVEAGASANAVIFYAQHALSSGKPTLITEKVRQDVNYNERKSILTQVTPIHVEQAANDGDEAALQILDWLSWSLAHGIRGVIQDFDPVIFTISGGMSHWKGLIREIRKKLRTLDGVVPCREVKVVASTLENPGILGPAAMALYKFA